VLAFALALGASLSWGTGDFIGGLRSRRLPVLTVIAASQLAALPVIAAAFLIAGGEIAGAEFVVYSALAGASQVLGLAAYYRALSTGAMGAAAPISATGVLIPVVIGLAGGDRPTALQAIGVSLAIVGVVLISLQPSRASSEGSAIATGVGMAMLGALGIGSFYVLMDAASSRGDIVPAVFINRSTVFAMLAAAALVFGVRPSLLRAGDWRDLAFVGVLASAATLMFAAATNEGLLSLVSVVGSLYPVATILLARFVLSERLRRAQRLGAVAALVGVAMIAA
jgi:drug/metabolite transporter (DMT)-like permease